MLRSVRDGWLEEIPLKFDSVMPGEHPQAKRKMSLQPIFIDHELDVVNNERRCDSTS
jgi:hypothetical protein